MVLVDAVGETVGLHIVPEIPLRSPQHVVSREGFSSCNERSIVSRNGQR
jgi:hypothetical protein